MAKLYAFLWHMSHEDMAASEGAGGYYCEAAGVEKPTREAAKRALEAWLNERKKECGDANCDHAPLITDKLTPDLIKAGLTFDMAQLQ